MDANVPFGKALGLGSGWKVVMSEMNVAGQQLKIWLDVESGSQFACRNEERSVRFTVRWRRSGGIWTFGSIALSWSPECRASIAGNTAGCKPRCLGRGLAAIYPHDGGHDPAAGPADERVGGGAPPGGERQTALVSA
jgi:hypothetical protein